VLCVGTLLCACNRIVHELRSLVTRLHAGPLSWQRGPRLLTWTHHVATGPQIASLPTVLCSTDLVFTHYIMFSKHDLMSSSGGAKIVRRRGVGGEIDDPNSAGFVDDSDG